jgi:hypothetical protein
LSPHIKGIAEEMRNTHLGEGIFPNNIWQFIIGKAEQKKRKKLQMI